MGYSDKILITGGLGYLGGRIATHLAATEPICSLRLMTSRNLENVPDWTDGLELVRANLEEDSSLEAALEGINTVVHLAGINEIESQRDPELALRVNGMGTLRLLNLCLSQGIRRFIYFSTFHVYGQVKAQHGVLNITEGSVARPVHPYAITHHLAEDWVNWFRVSHGMEVVTLRLSNGFGYPADPLVQRWSLVFNDLCMQAVQDKQIRLRTSGRQQRDFISLTDVSRGVDHLLNLPTGAWMDGLFNFGGDCSLSILEVAQQVASEYLHSYGTDIPITIGPEEDSRGTSPIVYNMNKLKNTGFSLVGNMSEEIRGTFKVCEQVAAIPTQRN